jgi:hypothetical protein
MIQIPAGVVNPVLIRDPVTINAEGAAHQGIDRYRIIDLSAAKALCKDLLARESGTAFRRLIDGNGKKSKRKLPVFELRRDSGISSPARGESRSMRPSQPSRGAIVRSRYARSLDGFVHKHPASVEIFKVWEGAKVPGGRTARDKPIWKGAKVTDQMPEKEVAKIVAERSILFMPSAGPITGKGKDR